MVCKADFLFYTVSMNSECKSLRGFPVSPGVVYGEVVAAKEESSAEIPRRNISEDQIEYEWKRFEEALNISKKEIAGLKEGGDKTQNEILDAQLLMLNDPEFLPLVKKELESKLVNIESALDSCICSATALLRSSGDEYLACRAADIEDAFGRVMRRLLDRCGRKECSGDSGGCGCSATLAGKILAAGNISPSYAVSLKKAGVAAIVLEEGGPACHVAILARSWNIPAVVGVRGLCGTAGDFSGMRMLVDGRAGTVFINPPEKYAEDYIKTEREKAASSKKTGKLPSETSDGVPFSLLANIAVPGDCAGALSCGAAGVGLFRSEFLFLRDDSFSLPDEEEQFEAYSSAARAMDGRPVTIRTLDVGGDKSLSSQAALKEKNPLLGWRAIRFCLDEKEIFQTQLRAVLRASAFGDVRIMFPMVASVYELDKALSALEEAKASCRRDGFNFNENIMTGVMIEIPSVAVCADIMARRVSFMSVGSNDLIQYTMAADRENPKVSYLYNCFDPAVLRLIKNVIDAGGKHGTEVSLCGEMGGNPVSACLLFGMGLRKFSMSAALMEQVSAALSSCSSVKLEQTAEAVLRACSSAEAESILERELGGITAGL